MGSLVLSAGPVPASDVPPDVLSGVQVLYGEAAG
jgi:hypothetical protein